MAVLTHKLPSVNTRSSDFMPLRTLEIEIGQPLPTLSAFDKKKARYYQCARCLVRLHARPLGLIELTFTGEELPPSTYAPRIWQSLHAQINEHLRQDGLSQVTELTAHGIPAGAKPRCIAEREQLLASAPFVSIIVPTHERIDQLDTCLHSLLMIDYPHFEIIVVDNAPETSATLELVNKIARSVPFIRYEREDRQGPSWARNRGIMAAKGDLLAFTDDDVVVDTYWLAGLVKGFQANAQAVCVTGLVLPFELETPPQLIFEEVGGYNKGFEQRIISFDEDPLHLPFHPYIADRFGTGASMAFTAEFIRAAGGFDPALGRVGPVRCSQDIAVFFKLLARGHTMVYEPSSLAYHAHRRTYEHLRRQTYNHAVGYTAFLTKSLTENPHCLPDFLKKLPGALLSNLRSRFTPGERHLPDYTRAIQKELLVLRRKGLLYGPLAYARSRWQTHTLRQRPLPREDQ